MIALESSSLADVALFRDLAPDALARLERSSRVWQVGRGELILSGDRPHDVYIVLAGTVEILCATATEGDPVLAELRTGDCVGEFAAIAGTFGSALARAGEQATLLEIPRALFVQILREEPALAFGLLERLVGRIRDLNQQLAGLYELRDEVQRIQRGLFLMTV